MIALSEDENGQTSLLAAHSRGNYHNHDYYHYRRMKMWLLVTGYIVGFGMAVLAFNLNCWF